MRGTQRAGLTLATKLAITCGRTGIASYRIAGKTHRGPRTPRIDRNPPLVPLDPSSTAPYQAALPFPDAIPPQAGVIIPFPRAISRIFACSFSKARTSIWRMRSRLTL